MKSKERTNAMRRANRARRRVSLQVGEKEKRWEFVKDGFDDYYYLAVSKIFAPFEDGSTGYEPGKWFWCMHCERAYPSGSFKREHKRGPLLCPYPDCNGDIVLDAKSWNILKDCNPGYPDVPEQGAFYPLYGHEQK